MPRNVEDLIEKYIEDSDLPNFILTRAIQCGFEPSQQILEQFGSGYCPDNFFLSREHKLEQKLSYENQLTELLDSVHIIKQELQKNIDDKYVKEANALKEYLDNYERTMPYKYRIMRERVKTLSPKNEIETMFLKYIDDYFMEAKDSIDSEYRKSLTDLVMDTFEQDRYSLIASKIIKLEKSIKFIELSLVFDDSFFESISKKWFR